MDSIELSHAILLILKDGPVERKKLGGILFLLAQAYDITDHGKKIDPCEFLEDLEESYRWEEMHVKLQNGFVVKL